MAMEFTPGEKRAAGALIDDGIKSLNTSRRWLATASGISPQALQVKMETSFRAQDFFKLMGVMGIEMKLYNPYGFEIGYECDSAFEPFIKDINTEKFNTKSARCLANTYAQDNMCSSDDLFDEDGKATDLFFEVDRGFYFVKYTDAEDEVEIKVIPHVSKETALAFIEEHADSRHKMFDFVGDNVRKSVRIRSKNIMKSEMDGSQVLNKTVIW